MNLTQNRLLVLASFGLLAGASMSMMQGCDPEQGPAIPGCDLSCPAEGIVEGNASLTGVAQVDAFFGAVVDVRAAANGISGTLRSELDAIALSVELGPGATGAEIKTAIEAKLSVALDGGLEINYAPPACKASVDVAVSAAAECDATVDPGSVSVECSGSCEVEGGVTASCSGDATLSCTGTAPNFACEGTCEGTCELDVGGSCSGTCRGQCDAGCSVVDAQGNCAGACMGTCTGTCELQAGGSCEGMCTGSCTYQPASGTCEADASAKCEASAGGSVQCDASCEGEVQQPEVSAECQASVEAKADASIECTPPSLDVTWQWSAAYQEDLMLQAEFKAWVQGFKTHLGVMLAAKTKADILIESLGNLSTAGTAALEASADTITDGDIVGAFKVTNCGIPQLDAAAGLLTSAGEELSTQADASFEVLGAVGIGS